MEGDVYSHHWVHEKILCFSNQDISGQWIERGQTVNYRQTFETDAGQPWVVILENGFPPLYKPPGKYFEACARGLLLMLAPWPYHMEKRKISRSQCLQLNSMAHDISDEPWPLEMEAQMLSTPGWA